MIFKIFIRAFKITLKQKKMISLLWVVSLLFALPAFWVIHRSLNSYFGGRQVASAWLNGFDFNYLLEMINDFPTITMTVNGLAAGLMFLFLIVSLFLTGGMIGSLYSIVQTGDPADGKFAETFFQFSGKFFFRYLRVFIWTSLLSIFSFVFLMINSYAGIITVLLIALWVMTSDMTKIRLFSDNSGKVTRVYFSSLKWVLKNLLPMSGIYLINFLVLAIGFFLYKTVDNAFTPHSAFMILIMFLLQQLFVLFRTMIRIQIFGSAICLWIEKSPDLESEPEIPAVGNTEQALSA